MTKDKFLEKLNCLFNYDDHLILWGIREGWGWDGTEWQAVIEDTESGAILKIRYEINNNCTGNETPDIYFMAHSIGWSLLGSVLKMRREEFEKMRQENRRIGEQLSALGIDD